MLISPPAEHYAYQLLEARAHARSMARLSQHTDLSLDLAYAIAHSLDKIRIAEGETWIGRKLGFNNHKLSQQYVAASELGATPICTSLFSSTVRFLSAAHTWQSLSGALRPRLGPELVFKLARTPEPHACLAELADCIEWVALGIGIDVCPYPDWEFTLADAIAAFGLHGTLLIGTPLVLSSANRSHLSDMLACASVSLSCDAHLVAAGYSGNIHPVHALWHLHQRLHAQPVRLPLQAGEIIATGSWTGLYPINAGQSWCTAFSGLNLDGLTLHLVE